eukprot:gene3086-3857_t
MNKKFNVGSKTTTITNNNDNINNSSIVESSDMLLMKEVNNNNNNHQSSADDNSDYDQSGSIPHYSIYKKKYHKAPTGNNSSNGDGYQEEEDPSSKNQKTPILVLFYLYFIVIASVLGTGSISYPIFIFSVILHFCSTLISYGLAGSAAYGQVFNVNHAYIIFPVVVIFSAIVIFGSNFLQHIITFFTFGKGTLLITVVGVTAVVADQVKNTISNDWNYIGSSFLISTVALGGASSVLPVVFPKIIFTRKEMMKCYITVFSALSTVYILNIMWCWFLLRIIPQVPNPSNPEMPSLQVSAEEGQIATIPLMHVIKLYYPQFLWIARIVDIFMVISITISFITVGNGFKHTLDGFSQTWRSLSLSSYNNSNTIGEDDNQMAAREEIQQFKLSTTTSSIKFKILNIFKSIKQKIVGKFNWVNQKIDTKEGQSLENSSIVRIPIREFIFYGIFFGFILLVAVLNPKSFLMVMEGGTSLGLNLQS